MRRLPPRRFLLADYLSLKLALPTAALKDEQQPGPLGESRVKEAQTPLSRDFW